MKQRFLPFTLALFLIPAMVEAQSLKRYQSSAPGEIRIFGKHKVRGTDEKGQYKGGLTVSNNGAFTCTKRYSNGSATEEKGRVSVDQKQLKLTFSDKKVQLFRRVLEGQKFLWKTQQRKQQSIIDSGQKKESTVAVASRMIKRKRLLHWLLKNNEGTLTQNKNKEKSFSIYRSKQPSADNMASWAKKGVKTLLSLNGEQDEKSWYHAKNPKTQKYLKAREVVLGNFIKDELGLHHVIVKMSASRAPRDAELVKVFQVFMNEKQGSILFHCRGGSDRTGVIAALYQIEFLGIPKKDAKATMRKHLWAANDGTEIQGLYIDLYRKGHIRALLKKANVSLPKRFQLNTKD